MDSVIGWHYPSSQRIAADYTPSWVAYPSAHVRDKIKTGESTTASAAVLALIDSATDER